MSIYETNPLLKGHTHIRLLKILPVSASSQDRITCSFELFDLNAAPRYQALSYEWGPKTPVKEIEVINQPTTIRQNLWNFLSRLRAHCYYGFLWCDAICIDQANDNERNHQVQLMSQIYRNAHSVLAWLGEEDRDSSTTLSQIRSMSVVEKSFGELRLRETIWRGLVALSERTYWTRIWIVQEITVAEVIQLFCGAEVIRWPDFAMACTFITANEPIGDSQIWAKWLWDPTAWERKRLGDAERMIHSTIQALSESTMYGLFRSHDRWPRYKKSFQTLSNRYSTSGCEDPRDRIFALLIISREVVVDHPFTVDYSKSMEETFFALAEWAAAGPVKTDRRLEFAVLVADVLNMHWGEYLLETKIDADSQRSPIFFQWIEKLCDPNVTKSWPLPLDTDNEESKLEPEFYLFGVAQLECYLICKPTHGCWTAVARAIDRKPDKQKSCEITFTRFLNAYEVKPTIFQGCMVTRGKNQALTIELSNVAQFMELLFEECDTLADGRLRHRQALDGSYEWSYMVDKQAERD